MNEVIDHRQIKKTHTQPWRRWVWQILPQCFCYIEPHDTHIMETYILLMYVLSIQ